MFTPENEYRKSSADSPTITVDVPSETVIRALLDCSTFSIFPKIDDYEEAVIFSIQSKDGAQGLASLSRDEWEKYKAQDNALMNKCIELPSEKDLPQ